MANQLILIFSAEGIQELLSQSPDKIVVRSSIEEGRLDTGEAVGYIKVFADAMQGGNVLATIEGCPEPPCAAG